MQQISWQWSLLDDNTANKNENKRNLEFWFLSYHASTQPHTPYTHNSSTTTTTTTLAVPDQECPQCLNLVPDTPRWTATPTALPTASIAVHHNLRVGGACWRCCCLASCVPNDWSVPKEGSSSFTRRFYDFLMKQVQQKKRFHMCPPSM